jgi:hypothetical protein
MFGDFSMTTTARENNSSNRPPAITNLQREAPLAGKRQFFCINYRGMFFLYILTWGSQKFKKECSSGDP